MLRALFCGLAVATAAVAQSTLTTTFVSNNGGSVGGAVYFDLNVTTPVTVLGLDLNIVGTGSVEIYTTPGTRVGNQTNPAAWTLLATGTVTGGVADAQTPVALAPFQLPFGSNGYAIRTIGVNHRYTNGTGANQVVATPEITLTAGEATNVAFSGTVLSPRVVNTRIRYVRGDYAPLAPHTTIYNGYTRGYNFTAQTDFNILSLSLPPDAYQAGDTASYVVLINGAVAFRSIGNANTVYPGLHVSTGDVVNVLGNWSPASPGTLTAHNSYTPAAGAGSAPYATTIAGVAHTLNRTGWQWDIGDPAWTPNGSTGTQFPVVSGSMGRVVMTTEFGSTFASNTDLGTGCNATFGSFYEYFATSGSFDLGNSAISFVPNGQGGYTITRLGNLLPVGSISAPTQLVLGDDSQVSVPFTTGAFPGWSGVTICSNGFVSQASGNGTGFTPSATTMLNAPQQAFWSWHDYNPSTAASGKVKIEQGPGITVITWDGVHDFSSATPNTLQFQLYASGVCTICWGAMSGNGNAHLVGYSPGGLSPNPGSFDISTIVAPVVLPAEVLPLTLQATSRPVLGTNWDMTLYGIPATGVLGVDILGGSDPGINDLAFLGMPTCPLRASLDVLDAWFVAGSTHNRSWFVPNNTVFLGVNIHAASAVFMSPPANAFGAFTSNGVRGLLGDV